MDILVFTVGSVAAVTCGWFALQILFKLLLGVVKLGVLAVLAYLAAQVTWMNAEVSSVASTEVAGLIQIVSASWESLEMPTVKVKLNFDDETEVPLLSGVGFNPQALRTEVLEKESTASQRYF